MSGRAVLGASAGRRSSSETAQAAAAALERRRRERTRLVAVLVGALEAVHVGVLPERVREDVLRAFQEST